jgi:hypothetical protein
VRPPAAVGAVTEGRLPIKAEQAAMTSAGPLPGFSHTCKAPGWLAPQHKEQAECRRNLIHNPFMN